MSIIKQLADITEKIIFVVAGTITLAAFLIATGILLFLLIGCSSAPTRDQKEQYIDKWSLSDFEANKIREGKIWIGAAWRDVHASIGKPDTVSVTRTRKHHYLVMRYPCRNLYVRDGLLETIQGSDRCSGAAPGYPPPAMPYPGFGVRKY